MFACEWWAIALGVNRNPLPGMSNGLRATRGDARDYRNVQLQRRGSVDTIEIRFESAT